MPEGQNIGEPAGHAICILEDPTTFSASGLQFFTVPFHMSETDQEHPLLHPDPTECKWHHRHDNDAEPQVNTQDRRRRGRLARS